MNPESQQQEIKEIIIENQKLLIENNELLKKMHRSAVRHMWLNILWIVFFLGIPMLLLYNVIRPMLETVSGGEASFGAQLKEVNELRDFLEQQR